MLREKIYNISLCIWDRFHSRRSDALSGQMHFFCFMESKFLKSNSLSGQMHSWAQMHFFSTRKMTDDWPAKHPVNHRSLLSAFELESAFDLRVHLTYDCETCLCCHLQVFLPPYFQTLLPGDALIPNELYDHWCLLLAFRLMIGGTICCMPYKRHLLQSKGHNSNMTFLVYLNNGACMPFFWSRRDPNNQ